MKKTYFIVDKAENTPKMRLYGYIGGMDGINARKVVDELVKLEEEGCKKVNIHIHSEGGSVMEGISIFHAIQSNSMTVNVYIDGLAASMASVIAAAADNVYMAKYARMMVHKVSGAAYGDAEKLKEMADLVNSLEADLVDIYAARTEKEKDWIRDNWMKTGIDKWFTAEEAKQNKLIDGIFDGPVNKTPDAHLTRSGMYNFYNQIIFNSINTDEMDIKKITSTLNIEAGSTETTVLQAIQTIMKENAARKTKIEKLLAENTQLKEENERNMNENIQSFVTAQVKRTGLTKEQAEKYMKLAKADFENTKELMLSLPDHKSIKDVLDGGSKEGNDVYKDYTFADFQEKAPDALRTMKQHDPERFKNLFKAEYGKEPNV